MKKKVRPTSKFVEFWRSERCRKLRGACYVLLALFVFVAMVSLYVSGFQRDNWLGIVGYSLSFFLVRNTFGVASVGWCLILFLYGFRLWKVNLLPFWRTFWCTLFWMLWISTVLGYINGVWGKGNEVLGICAGSTGSFVAEIFYKLIRWGTLVILGFVGIVFLVFVHHVRLPKISLPKRKPREKEDYPETPAVDKVEELPTEKEASFRWNRQPPQTDTPPQQEQPREQTPHDPSFTINTETGQMEEESIEPPMEPEEEPEEHEEPSLPNSNYGSVDSLYDPHLDLKQFIMPQTDLLTDWETRNEKVTKEELVENKDRIVETLHNYGIEIVEIAATPGPTVTLYEIRPAAGVRISKIKSLEDDIALSLSALGIRIIAPIPGKGTVGIEVPNTKPQIVSMKTMLESEAFRKDSKMELPIALGKTISNDPFVTDLAKMPHLLMAGATGTGKSVGLNAVIASLLYKKHPSELKFVMVDPKKVELSLYNKIERHYLAKLPDSEEAIITDVKKVVRTLNSLCIEMDNRYDLLRQAGVRKVTEYNDKFIHRHLNPENGHRYLPYIVLVVDEFADLIMTAGKEVELPICRLAQLARAVGIHLIIATQRPTTNIITGTIKANFPARVAFKVTSGIDSRTILDCGGAQRLIGRGDMLISLSGTDLVRLQCALIETSEIEELADFIGSQRGYPDGFLLPEYLDENEEPNKDFDPKQKDEFFNDAARLVVASQFGSTSLLQRKLQLGYNRAGRIIDQLEAAGIVGPYNGSKARDVLVHDETQLEEILRSL